MTNYSDIVKIENPIKVEENPNMKQGWTYIDKNTKKRVNYKLSSKHVPNNSEISTKKIIKTYKKMSEHWNKLKRYVETDEFVSYFRDFSGVPVTKCKYFLRKSEYFKQYRS